MKNGRFGRKKCEAYSEESGGFGMESHRALESGGFIRALGSHRAQYISEPSCSIYILETSRQMPRTEPANVYFPPPAQNVGVLLR